MKKELVNETGGPRTPCKLFLGQSRRFFSWVYTIYPSHSMYTLEDYHRTYKSPIYQTSMIMFHVNLQGRVKIKRREMPISVGSMKDDIPIKDRGYLQSSLICCFSLTLHETAPFWIGRWRPRLWREEPENGPRQGTGKSSEPNLHVGVRWPLIFQGVIKHCSYTPWNWQQVCPWDYQCLEDDSFPSGAKGLCLIFELLVSERGKVQKP